VVEDVVAVAPGVLKRVGGIGIALNSRDSYICCARARTVEVRHEGEQAAE